MSSAIIETPRLLLKEFTSSDSEFIIELLNSPGWLKYIGTRNVSSAEDAVNYIENRIRRSYLESGFGFYKIELRTNGAIAGMCGLVKRDSLEEVDIGFALLPQYENNGYAFEASEAVMNFAKEKLKLHRLAAITVPYNNSSVKLLEKLGMKFERTIHLPDDPEALMLFNKDLSN